jgi:transposase
MQSYSQDLRERVLWALDRSERPSSIARRLEVSRVWVYQVRDRAQKLGKRTSFQIGGHRRSRVAEMESVLQLCRSAAALSTTSRVRSRLRIYGIA